jgi:hypothetical protein
VWEFKWRLSAESRYAEIRMPPGQRGARRTHEADRKFEDVVKSAQQAAVLVLVY